MKMHLFEAEKNFWKWVEMQGWSKTAPKHLRHHLRPFFQFLGTQGVMDESYTIDLSGLTRQVIADYQNFISEWVSPQTGERIKAQTQTNRLTSLKAFLRFLKQTGRIQSDPGEVITLPRRAQQVPASLLTVEEVRKLLNTPDTGTVIGFRNRTVLELFWCTGMRISEVSDLQVDDVLFQQSAIRIREGKGGKERLVPIGKAVSGWLKEYIDRVRPLLIKPYQPETNALFLSTQGIGVRISAVLRIVADARQKAKLKKRITAHSFRHTLATEMLREGADLRYIQQMLGHEKITTTQRYLQLVKADLKKVHASSHPRETETGLPE